MDENQFLESQYKLAKIAEITGQHFSIPLPGDDTVIDNVFRILTEGIYPDLAGAFPDEEFEFMSGVTRSRAYKLLKAHESHIDEFIDTDRSDFFMAMCGQIINLGHRQFILRGVKLLNYDEVLRELEIKVRYQIIPLKLSFDRSQSHTRFPKWLPTGHR